MSQTPESNFLFALIAYQNGYLTMEQFFEAAQAWNTNPKLDIGDILVELKFLQDVERYNIQGIVEDRIRRQGGLDKTLSFVLENNVTPNDPKLPDSWKERVEAITKGDDKARLAPPKFDAPKPNSGIQRYIIRKTLGYGGQGYVWEAIDTELNRKVAIKNIVPNLSSSPIHQELLIDEARKTGKLGHGGIPSVFDIGKDDDGKPFFTMQLIHGEKLSERYKNRLNYESISRSDYVSQIRPLLRHLIAASKTVQFAFNTEAVIHRDLKPSNIMVNEYGDTVVMDWGLGKIVNDPNEISEDASSVSFIPYSLGSGSVDKTSAGTIKGSVTFMSPEQARGENDRLDHRTDVYGLGAILYWILTGHPPHQASRAALTEIQNNRFKTPSQLCPSLSIPKELEAICLKAMASSPDDRYQKSGEFADDIENFLAGEPIVALPDNFLRKSERFLRKHARGVIASLLALSLAVLGLSLANLIINRQRMIIKENNVLLTSQKTTLENQEVELKNNLSKINSLNNQLVGANADLESKNQKIEAEKNKTKESRKVASDTLESVVGYLIDDGLAQVPGAYQVRVELLQDIAKELEIYIGKNPDDEELKLDLVRLLIRLAKLQGDGGQTQEANQSWQRADELLEASKDVSDQTFQIQWKKTFCDKAYFNTSALLNQGLNAQADAMLKRASLVAAELMQQAQDKKEYAFAYARVLRRKTDLLDRAGDWTAALANSMQINQELESMVAEHLPKLLSEPNSSEIIQELNHGTLGYYILISSDQGDYETALGKYADAEKSYLKALQGCKLAPRVKDALRDGSVQGTNQLRRLQRLAFLSNDYQKADGYYKQAQELSSPNREDPYVEKLWFFIESDRARALAESNLDEAIKALKESQASFEKIKSSDAPEFAAMRSNKKVFSELQYAMKSASNAVAKKNGDAVDSESLDILMNLLEELQASPLLKKEIRYLPN